MRYLSYLITALILGTLVVIIGGLYFLLEPKGIPLVMPDPTAAEAQQLKTRLTQTAQRILKSEETEPFVLTTLNEREVNALIHLYMKWNRGIAALNEDPMARTLAEGYGETWGLRFEEGTFLLTVHYQVFSSPILVYFLGSHFNLQARFKAAFTRSGFEPDMTDFQVSWVNLPPFAEQYITREVVKAIRLHATGINRYAPAIQAKIVERRVRIQYDPFALQQILLADETPDPTVPSP